MTILLKNLNWFLVLPCVKDPFHFALFNLKMQYVQPTTCCWTVPLQTVFTQAAVLMPASLALSQWSEWSTAWTHLSALALSPPLRLWPSHRRRQPHSPLLRNLASWSRNPACTTTSRTGQVAWKVWACLKQVSTSQFHAGCWSQWKVYWSTSGFPTFYYDLVPLGDPLLSTRTTSSRTTNLIESLFIQKNHLH